MASFVSEGLLVHKDLRQRKSALKRTASFLSQLGAKPRGVPGVGENGTVYAVDINPESTKYIDERARREGIRNVRTLLSTPDDPKLPNDSVDSVLILKTYHEIAAPIALLRNLRSSLRSGARIGIIDRNGNGEDHGVQKEVVVKEATEAGYRLAGQYDFVKNDREDYFLVFEIVPDRQ